MPYLCGLLPRFNIKRAFRQSLVLHAALYFLLIVASGMVMVSSLLRGDGSAVVSDPSLEFPVSLCDNSSVLTLFLYFHM